MCSWTPVVFQTFWWCLVSCSKRLEETGSTGMSWCVAQKSRRRRSERCWCQPWTLLATPTSWTSASLTPGLFTARERERETFRDWFLVTFSYRLVPWARWRCHSPPSKSQNSSLFFLSFFLLFFLFFSFVSSLLFFLLSACITISTAQYPKMKVMASFMADGH